MHMPFFVKKKFFFFLAKSISFCHIQGNYNMAAFVDAYIYI